jgi:WD40 repeat protein
MRRGAALILGLYMSVVGALVAAPAPKNPPGPANVYYAPAGQAPLPGRGLALAWSPDGSQIAAGGHFKEKATGKRYDTRIIDVATRTLLAKSFDCHYWWVVAVAWTINPFIGEVIADGGGDHSVKIWDAYGPGSTSCDPGQFRASDGGVKALYDINGWVTSLEFSPDGRYLAAASRDRAVRIWQVEPGPRQWKVVRLWYDKDAGNFLSVRWSPDGSRLVTGDREGRVAEWSFDPAIDLWNDATIESFAKTGWQNHLRWFKANAAVTTRTPLWIDGKHKDVWNARYSPDGLRIAAAGADGTVSVFASGTGTVLYRVTVWRKTPLHGLDWSPDGALIAVGGADKRIYIFNAIDGTPFDRLEGHGEDVTAIAWSPDGATLASTAGGPRVNLGLNDVVTGPDDYVRFWTLRP